MFLRRIRKKDHGFEKGEGTLIAKEAKLTNGTGQANRLKIGSECLISGQLLVGKKGLLEIGNHSYVGPEARIWSLQEVRIGSRVFISHGVNIHDSDSHSLSACERHERFLEKMRYGRHLVLENAKSAPVFIEDDVWIGFNAIILKGVKIGKGAVVGAGSVITKNVEPFTVVVGNPHRVVGKSLP
jgi:acetyltransferase-like isoleucine patch superfamily enzyme